MNNIELLLAGARKVLFAGLVFGAGLPFVYAVALRVLTIGSTDYVDADGTIRSKPKISSALFSGLLITVVVSGIVLGLILIVASGFGKALSFESIIPTIVDK